MASQIQPKVDMQLSLMRMSSYTPIRSMSASHECLFPPSFLTFGSKQRKFLGCLRRNNFVTVIFKQTSEAVPGDFLGRLVLGVEDDKVKVFGATIF